MKLKHAILFLFATAFIFIACQNKMPREMQLSHDLGKNFNLDNNDNFSPDDRWLVYDTRTDEGGIGGCRTIEKINVETGKTIVLYKTKNATQYGPGVGAASFSPVENKVVFIHGLQNYSAERPYAQWRRTGVIIDESNPNVPIFMDARDVTFPYTPGALRGGTHRHEWSGDGKWIGFTYNDAVMETLEEKTGGHWNLRTIGVSHLLHPVKVDHGANDGNIDGAWFSVLVVKVVPNPKPGSDEISHAADDSWVGTQGYQKKDGTWQRARAFLGTVRSERGEEVKELYVVDIPEKINSPGEDGPLEGTQTSFPMPPKGTVQRRLTFTAKTQHPGCSGIVRSSPDGTRIAYLAMDDKGIQQVFFMSPTGGRPVQITHHKTPVQSGVRWNPDGTKICYLWENSIVICDVTHGKDYGKFRKLTTRSDDEPTNLVWSHNGKMIAFNRTVETNGGSSKQIYLLRL